MIPYAYAFKVSIIANAVVSLPIMLLHGFPLLDSLGIAAIVGITGAAPALRACRFSDASLAEKRRLVIKFTLFCPVFILFIHALLWSEARFTDDGRWLPGTPLHWVNWLLAMATLIGWIAFYYKPRRAR